MAREIDHAVHLVVGPGDTRGRPVRDVVLEAVEGGATVVQLRWKSEPSRGLVDEARGLLAELRPRGVPLVINDRVDVALAVGADGVHVGQSDMRVEDVRRIAGREIVVGLSITRAEEARAADVALADYAGVGPVFATLSKSDASEPLGLDGVAEVCRLLAIPTVAIGGISIENAASVVAAGVRGVAVISAVAGASDPREAAARLVREVRGAAGIHTRAMHT